jgi:hypothetical protein
MSTAECNSDEEFQFSHDKGGRMGKMLQKKKLDNQRPIREIQWPKRCKKISTDIDQNAHKRTSRQQGKARCLKPNKASSRLAGARQG